MDRVPWWRRLRRLFVGDMREHAGAAAVIRGPARFVDGLADPNALVSAMGAMHGLMTDLTGVPPAGSDRTIVAHELGTHGAMWAYGGGEVGHHIGVPPETWPNMVAAANRRPYVSALVHEVGHLALGWDRDPASGRPYMMWGAAIEGLATPTGSYALAQAGLAPSWIDYPAGDRDWATLADWVGEWVRQGLVAYDRGARGDDGIDAPGHGPGAAICEAAMFDLLFRLPVGYAAYRAVLREYVANRRTPAWSDRHDEAKVAAFFVALGHAAKADLGPYMRAWGFDTAAMGRELAIHPALPGTRPPMPTVNYG